MSVDEVFDAAHTVKMCVDFLQGCAKDPNALREFIPQLLAAKLKLRDAPPELFDSAADLDLTRPVKMGEWAAPSYLEMTRNIGTKWSVAISSVGDCASEFTAADYGTSARLAAIAEKLIAKPQEWWELARRIPLANVDELGVGLRLERKRLTAVRVKETHDAEGIGQAAGQDLVARDPAFEVRVKLGETNIVFLDDKAFAVKPNGYKLFELLLEAPGEYVSLANHGLRTRDVQALPDRLKDVVESDPGAGTRIKREYLA